MLVLRGRILPAALCVFLSVSGIVSLPFGALAASPEPGDSTYHSLCYEDDFSYLAGPTTQPPDFWDPLKYVPLGEGPYGPSYLSFGGELTRLRGFASF